MSVAIRIDGLKEVQRALAKLDGEMNRVVQLVAKGVGYEVKSEAQTYPAKRHIPLAKVGGFVSDKQRRWFFWALSTGQIQVPYKRKMSAGLQGAWTVKKHGQTGAVVNQPKPYGPYVHGDEEQTRMMAAIGWRTTSEIAKSAERSGSFEAVAQKVINSVLGRLGLK